MGDSPNSYEIQRSSGEVRMYLRLMSPNRNYLPHTPWVIWFLGPVSISGIPPQVASNNVIIDAHSFALTKAHDYECEVTLNGASLNGALLNYYQAVELLEKQTELSRAFVSMRHEIDEYNALTDAEVATMIQDHLREKYQRYRDRGIVQGPIRVEFSETGLSLQLHFFLNFVNQKLFSNISSVWWPASAFISTGRSTLCNMFMSCYAKTRRRRRKNHKGTHSGSS